MKYSTAWKQALIPGTILALVLLIGLPLLNGLGVLSDYYLNLFGKYLALAILALGMDLIWGYAGILSLGQAIFFGFGAYAMGMYLMLASSGQGVYGERIPDFMVWNRGTALPLFWKPFQYNGRAVARFQTVRAGRSEEHTSELQSPDQLVCRLLREKTQMKLTATRIFSSVFAVPRRSMKANCSTISACAWLTHPPCVSRAGLARRPALK